MKEIMRYSTIVFSLIFGTAILLCSFYLNDWSLRNLNPCCFEMCGATHSFDECLPYFIAGILDLCGFCLLLFALLNMLVVVFDREGKKK